MGAPHFSQPAQSAGQERVVRLTLKKIGRVLFKKMSNEAIECIEPILIDESTDWKFELSSLRTLFDCAAATVSIAPESVLGKSEDSKIAADEELRDTISEHVPNGWLFQLLMD